MPQPVRVLHFADTHIGMENYGKLSPRSGLSTRVEDFLRRMDEMIEFARDHEVDLVIFAGDAFKTRNPTPTYQREFAFRIRDLAELAPVVLLVGNHDVPPVASRASSIEIYDTLGVPNVWVADDYETQMVQTRRGDVLVGAAPYPIRSRILTDEDTAGMTIAESDQYLREKLVGILEGMAAEAEAHDGPRLLTGHFTVDGAVWGSERSIMLGRDIQVPLSVLADSRWDYVALGHVHRHQNLTHNREGAPSVVYSGSLERIDFGEEGDTKGFCWVELERGKTRWEFHPVNARRFVTVELDLRDSTTPTQDVVDYLGGYDLEDAVVRVRLDLSPEGEAVVNEGPIRDALRMAGVSVVAAIDKRVEKQARTRLGSSPEGLTDEQLLERYLLSRQVDPERRAELLEAARAIFETAGHRE